MNDYKIEVGISRYVVTFRSVYPTQFEVLKGPLITCVLVVCCLDAVCELLGRPPQCTGLHLTLVASLHHMVLQGTGNELNWCRSQCHFYPRIAISLLKITKYSYGK